MASRITAKQRIDYTFKYNRHFGRHGWLRLTPAYSVKLVEEILTHVPPETNVFDPFSGTATTLLCAGYHHLRAVGYELNPFLVWFGKTKTRQYSAETLQAIRDTVAQIASEIRQDAKIPCISPPPIHALERWWHPAELEFLCKLKTGIENAYPVAGCQKDLLLVIFCRLVVKLSNAAFNHQSMSFKDTQKTQTLLLFADSPDFVKVFLAESEKVVASARDNPAGEIEIMQGDARTLAKLADQSIDLLITSPPYPNRMSYIRELRPYMYWLGYLNNGRDAGELDWQAIGGTWGIATSRLANWEKSPDGFYPSYLNALLSAIAQSSEKNGRLLSNYVAKYFEDMWQHLHQVQRVMKPGGAVHYIVGNSKFYEVMVPVEQIYKEMFERLGFQDVTVKTIRKRNSKKSLYEFDVAART